MPKDAKPFKGIGSGVFEMALAYESNAYRAVYAVQLGTRIYVLHAFQKKCAYSSDGTDSTSQRINHAAANGIVPVVAAGNSGSSVYTIGSPAAARDAITVGAIADIGESGFYQASFSSRGPTADGRVKPDISAPNITAAMTNSGTLQNYTA